MKAKMEAESKALQEKLDKEASALKNKLTEGEESRKKESKALQDKLEKDKAALAKQVNFLSKITSDFFFSLSFQILVMFFTDTWIYFTLKVSLEKVRLSII